MAGASSTSPLARFTAPSLFPTASPESDIALLALRSSTGCSERGTRIGGRSRSTKSAICAGEPVADDQRLKAEATEITGTTSTTERGNGDLHGRPLHDP